jgi:Tfp pilus assembly protein PilF
LDGAGDEADAVEQWRQGGAAPLLARSRDTHMLELATRVDPAYPAARLRLAEAYLARGRWAAAERELKARLRLPEDENARLAEAHLLLGLTAYWADDEPAMAAEELRQAIAADPDDDSLYRGLAGALDQLGQSGEAGRLRDEARAVSRRTHRVSDTLGRAYATLGANLSLVPLARREYHLVAATDPIGNYDLGQLDLEDGNLREAVNQFQAAVQAIPNQEQFRLGLARAYLYAGEFRQAWQEYVAVLDLDPGNAEARRATSPAGYRA